MSGSFVIVRRDDCQHVSEHVRLCCERSVMTQQLSESNAGKIVLASLISTQSLFTHRCPIACGVEVSPAVFFAAVALILLIYSLVTAP